MNIPTALRTIAAAALIAAGLGAGAAHADQPAPDAPDTIITQGQTRISTDKMAYVVGEKITISYTLPAKGYIRIRDFQGTEVSTLRAGFYNSSEGSIQGSVSPPAGKECLTLEYSPRPLPVTPPDHAAFTKTPSGQGPAYAETCFEVKDKESKDQGQVPGPGLYTLRNRHTSQMLDSNPDKDVFPHAANGGAFQKWVLEAGPDGHVFLRDLATSYYLEASVGFADFGVATQAKHGGVSQQWKLEPATDGYLRLRNRATGKQLMEYMGDIRTSLLSDENGTGSHWTLTAVQP